MGRTSREPFCSDLHLIASNYQCSVNDFFSNVAPSAASDASAAVATAGTAPSGDGQRAGRIESMSAWRHPIAAALPHGAGGA